MSAAIVVVEYVGNTTDTFDCSSEDALNLRVTGLQANPQVLSISVYRLSEYFTRKTVWENQK